MSGLRGVLSVFSLSFLWLAAAPAGAQVESKCLSSQLKASGAYAAAQAKCESKAAAKGDLEGAERNFPASLDWARRQQAKMWELRTSTSLARLWQSQSRLQK